MCCTKNVKLYFWLGRSEEMKAFVKGIVPSADIFVCFHWASGMADPVLRELMVLFW